MAQPQPDTIPDPETEAYLAAVQEGIDDDDAGRVIPYDDVRRWLLTWGQPHEPLPPEFPQIR